MEEREQYRSSLRSSSRICRPEVAPSSSGEVVKYTFPTRNQSLKDCIVISKIYMTVECILTYHIYMELTT
ncbi:Hypothetical predicted protein [Marmota monax]|uniref:Uncharacterized protein n=1 Tax=Marmota monax TaxID=9995 RepID=A0A5E4D825_MARMO|nr:hypothetical protein GHT09_017999 [Marmota monax]VTJ89291.1 Hypothetical predicted protein [Marmota monax]